MTTLIFDTSVYGHHLEYLHHYYVGALDRQDENYIFCVPEDFEQHKGKYVWPKSINIRFQLMSLKLVQKYSSGNMIINAYRTSMLLRKVVKETNPDKVILSMLSIFLPFVTFMLPSNVRLRGVLYSIYLYNESTMSRLRLSLEKLRFKIMARSKIVERVFVLNDKGSSYKLNQIYGTTKFSFLPDPVPQVDFSSIRNLRAELQIPDGNTIFLHFGGIARRKGTLEILKAIIASDSDEIKEKTFIIAGQAALEMREELCLLIDEARRKTQVIFFDEFCSYDLLYNLCYTTDFILMPYQFTNLSSGVLGYAAVFDKPVIGPDGGLIGNLIKENNLGVTISDVSPLGIAPTFKLKKWNTNSNYKTNNSVGSFINVIFEQVK